MKKVIFASIFGLSVLSASASAVSLTAYTDRSAWEAAVGSFILEDFESFTSATPYITSPVDVGDFTVSVSGENFGSIWHNIGPVSNGNDVNGSAQLNAATGSTGGTTLAFDFSIFAFGADWGGVSDNRVTSLIVGGEALAIPSLSPGFFGFVADAAFSSLLLQLTSGSADGFGLDDAVYSTGVNAVPIPAAAFLFAPALLGFMGFRRRAKNLAA